MMLKVAIVSGIRRAASSDGGQEILDRRVNECEGGLSSALLSHLSALSLCPLSMRSSPNPIFAVGAAAVAVNERASERGIILVVTRNPAVDIEGGE